ncbi:MAG: helix-turn-helix transcriptional regulator [Bacilli bacterium]|nr:helix-turn-helix transcriptional regulator [Bacilli bacterium]
MDQIKIGKLITKKRLEKKLTQSELGNLLGVTDKSVSKWERGINIPDIALMTPLSEILDLTINEILSGEENPKEENKSVIDGIKFYNKKTRNKFVLILAPILIILITILGLFFINNYNQCKVYSIDSNNPEYKVHGYILFNPNENIIVLDDITYQGNLLGTNEEPSITKFRILLKVKDEVIENIEVEKSTGKLSEVLNNKSIAFEDFDNEKLKVLKKAKEENINLVFELYDDKGNKIEHKIDLEFTEKFNNNRLFYKKINN